MGKQMRRVASADEMLDLLSQMKPGRFATICYVNTVKIGSPMVKKKNPETNRMKSYVDYDTISNELGTQGIAGLLSMTRYKNLNWSSPDTMKKHYQKYKQDLNDIRAEYGIDPMGQRASFQQTNNIGNGVNTGKGDLQDRVYSNQNTFSCKKETTYFGVDGNGNILGEYTKDQVAKYMQAKAPDSGLKALQKITNDQAKLDSYTKRVKELGMRYTTFYADRILYIVGEDDYGYFFFINDNLCDKIGETLVNPQQFIDMAKKKYIEDYQSLNECVKNRTLLENRRAAKALKSMIREAIRREIGKRRVLR